MQLWWAAGLGEVWGPRNVAVLARQACVCGTVSSACHNVWSSDTSSGGNSRGCSHGTGPAPWTKGVFSRNGSIIHEDVVGIWSWDRWRFRFSCLMRKVNDGRGILKFHARQIHGRWGVKAGNKWCFQFNQETRQGKLTKIGINTEWAAKTSNLNKMLATACVSLT